VIIPYVGYNEMCFVQMTANLECDDDDTQRSCLGLENEDDDDDESFHWKLLSLLRKSNQLSLQCHSVRDTHDVRVIAGDGYVEIESDYESDSSFDSGLGRNLFGTDSDSESDSDYF